MAAELETPTDEFSGLPLPLMPTDELLPNDNGSVANWHHQFHPSTSPVLTDSIGGRALRCSRIQLVPVEHHNFTETAYHRFYAGPPIPEDPAEQFGIAVLSCAGYMPEYAIDVSTGDPCVRPMNDRQLEMLMMAAEPAPLLPVVVERFRDRRMPDATLEEAAEVLWDKRERQATMSYRNMRYGYDPMKQFLAEIVLEQDVSDMPRKIVGRFLANGDETEGMKLLDAASNRAAEGVVARGMPVDELYRQARDDGRLNPNMPPSAGTLIANKLGDFTRRTEILPRLRRRLLGAEEGVA